MVFTVTTGNLYSLLLLCALFVSKLCHPRNGWGQPAGSRILAQIVSVHQLWVGNPRHSLLCRPCTPLRGISKPDPPHCFTWRVGTTRTTKRIIYGVRSFISEDHRYALVIHQMFQNSAQIYSAPTLKLSKK